MTAFDHTFRAAIPGMSIAHHKLGELSHERPHKFTDPKEATEYFWKQLHRPDILRQIWAVLEKGADVRSIVNAILYKAGSMGIIGMNLGIVISPTIAKMIVTLGEARGIKNIKVMPKTKDKIKEQKLADHVNKHFPGRTDPLPPSAWTSMQVPKPHDFDNAQDFLGKLTSKQEPEQQEQPKQSKGLLSPIGKE